MKTLDMSSERILVIALSISIALLSLSAFLLTVQRVTAQPAVNNLVYQPSIIGLGIKNDVGYYLVLNGNRYDLATKRLP